MPKFIDLSGRRYRRLTVIKLSHRDARGTIHWLCRCDCETHIIVGRGDLQQGRTRSCGCLKKEITRLRSTKHGHANRSGRSGAYRSWVAMLQRCTNQTNAKNYSDRGIVVCKRWLKFENFFADMGERPPGLTLERSNNELGYKPSNCCWATRSAQMRNQRRTKLDIAQVNAIIADQRSNPVIARDYGLSREHVWAIKTGKTWQGLPASKGGE